MSIKTLMRIFTCEVVNDTIRDMRQNPDKWVQRYCTFDRRDKNIRIWTGSGLFFINFYQNEVRLSIISKWRLQRAIYKCKKANISKRFENE